MARVDQAEKVGEAKRCGKCENCVKFEKARQSCLACCGTPKRIITRSGRYVGNEFNHADDGVVQVWNDACRDYPCLAYTGCDGAGPHQDGPTYKFKLYGIGDDNVYILCRACWERMEQEHMEEEFVPAPQGRKGSRRAGLIEDAARATEIFSEDELEAHAKEVRDGKKRTE